MWNLTSRVHKLNHFSAHNAGCYVKRDDELSCGISGTKLRKYSSIIPFLIEKQIKHLIIIAGPQSNNLLAALQIARELNFKVTAFLLKPKSTIIQGNFKLSLLFLNSTDIIWVERSDWLKVDETASDYAHQLKEPAFVLNEGASVPQAMKGAMSLSYDIQKNEEQLGLQFQHIFIDAGTGFSAAALINGLHQIKHASHIHVLLLADKEGVFSNKLKHWLGFVPENYSCFYPNTARSFGSVNQEIKNEIRRLALEEGILADPIYSAKLFHESRRYLQENSIKENTLIIHSGGALTLNGFDLS
jgi:1-aminocyclopropane-1-carboxylate deaminase/D-cysteine desulfhydrase-like pyridoxal-dependent ACC family enzyme